MGLAQGSDPRCLLDVKLSSPCLLPVLVGLKTTSNLGQNTGMTIGNPILSLPKKLNLKE